MAANLNKVTLIGRLGKDPEIRFFQDGTKVANFTMATSESWKDKATDERRERTEWHRVVVMNENLSNLVEQYVKKGHLLYVEGQVQTRKWTDQNGQERYTTEIVIPRFRGEIVLLESKGGSGNGGGAMDGDMDAMEQYHSTNTSPASKPSLPSKGQGAKSKFDDLNDDIPF